MAKSKTGAKKKSGKAAKLRRDIQKWFDAWRENNTRYHENMRMVMGQQWEEEDLDGFRTFGKQGMEFNKLLPIANYVLGQEQQNTPNLQLFPSDDTPADVAEVRQAILLDICLNSNAKQVKQRSFFQKLVGGYGCFRVAPEYEDDFSMKQILKLYDTKDATKCFWSLDAEHPNKIDSVLSGYLVKMSRKKFRALYGEEIERKIGYGSDAVGLDANEDSVAFWDDDSITILHVYERVYDPYTLYELSNGKALRKKELDALQEVEIEGIKFLISTDDNGQPEPVKIVNQRKVPRYRVMASKWGGDYLLDETDFHSQYSPMVFEDQNSYYDKNGKQVTKGFFENVRDAQRYLNYLKTQAGYILTVSRYDQYLVSKENVRSPDTEKVWKDPTIVIGALYYDETPSGNKPEQLRQPELSQSLMMQYDSTLLDIQSGTGVYSTQLGQNGGEISGEAIDSRRETGSYNTFVLFNSSNMALAAAGVVIDDMIPHIYDTERKLRLNMPDSGERLVTINKPKDEYESDLDLDITKGRYQLRLLPGKSLEGQKDEDLQTIELILAKNPELFNMVADLFADSLTSSKAIEIRNRLRTLVPPEIVEAGKTGNPLPPKPPAPDPVMINLENEGKMIALKQMEAQQKFTIEQQKLVQAQQKIENEGHKSGSDSILELEKLKTQQAELRAQFVETQNKYDAEMARIHADTMTTHHNNLAKILTHNTSFLDKPKELQTTKGTH